MTKTQIKHSPEPWEVLPTGDANFWRLMAGGNWLMAIQQNGELTVARQEANAQLIATAPNLLAYAECEAAVACGKADPRYDPKPVLISHGWNEQTESAGLFLSRIRREALEAATGSYLGRAA